MIRVGVIGFGRWGINLARCAAAHVDYRLSAICDLSVERRQAAAHIHPGTRLEADWRALIADPHLDALLLATPTPTHFRLAQAALSAGKHVMVEKPIARTSQEVAALIDGAEHRRLVLMTDHTYVFSPAVAAMRALLAGGTLGEIHAVESVRKNGDGIHRDVDVLWDLGTHDLSILDHLFGGAPCSVRANRCDTKFSAELALVYPGGLAADIKVSWRGDARTRRMQIRGSKGMLLFDDLEPVDKLSVRLGAAGAETRAFHPPLEQVEPLRNVVEHFAACILRGARPLSDGAAGLRVVRLLETAGRSLKSGGREIPVGADEVIA
jgi:predicted dehydrogenase